MWFVFVNLQKLFIILLCDQGANLHKILYMKPLLSWGRQKEENVECGSTDIMRKTNVEDLT